MPRLVHIRTRQKEESSYTEYFRAAQSCRRKKEVAGKKLLLRVQIALLPCVCVFYMLQQLFGRVGAAEDKERFLQVRLRGEEREGHTHQIYSHTTLSPHIYCHHITHVHRKKKSTERSPCFHRAKVESRFPPFQKKAFQDWKAKVFSQTQVGEKSLLM